MTNRIIQIEDQLNFQTGSPTSHLFFLINKSVKIQQVLLNNSQVNFKIKHGISKSKYFVKDDLTEVNTLKEAAELVVDLENKRENGCKRSYFSC